MEMIVKADVNLNPYEAAEFIWQMDTFQRLEVLDALAKIAPPEDILTEMEYLSEGFPHYRADEDAKKKMKWFVNKLKDYICEYN